MRLIINQSKIGRIDKIIGQDFRYLKKN